MVVTDWHVFGKELRLHCKQKRKFRATTSSDHKSAGYAESAESELYAHST
ncbi:Transposase (plasmid) [Shigella dysenteriae WRSd3]|uniref:Transposase n=1 Tax=Shigella dysenteriae WRSd3 TaxID=1401327 RepID=A0A090N903_SHIDY|nr:Transposase [Shigella dysenteriae WRSd3]